MTLQLFNITSYNKNKIDVQNSFRQIAEEFCKYYYTVYDNNFLELANLCLPNTLFTYMDEELIGFNRLVEKINKHYIYKFHHKQININFQPVGNNGIIILSTGTISLNDSIIENRFTESILLEMDDKNRFFIINNLFKII